MTVSFCDNFHRADGPLANGWTLGAGAFNVDIESNLAGHVDGSSIGSAFQLLCGGVTYQQAAITVVVTGGESFWDIYIACTDATGSPVKYITLNIDGPRGRPGSQFFTFTITDSDGNTVTADISIPLLATGDVVTLKSDSGGNVTADINGTVVLIMTSTVPITGVYTGFGIDENQISNFCTEVDACASVAAARRRYVTLVGAT